MALDGREPDGTLWILQDESCGHLLYIPAGEEDVYVWDLDPSRRFASEDDATAWHQGNCPKL